MIEYTMTSSGLIRLSKPLAEAVVLAFVGASLLSAPVEAKPRLLVLTDIGGDPDDMQSMRRLMLYANEFEIEGLVASASGTPREVGRAATRPELITEIVRDFAAVRDTLARHADGYPTAEALQAVIKSGSPKRGVPHIGEEHRTEGSEHIIAAVDASPEPLYVVIWGGAHDLAQALHDVRAGRGPDGLQSFLDKLRVYAIADQDAWRSQMGTGEWIRQNFPNLRYVESGPPEMERYAALFRGMYQNDSKGGGHPVVQLVPDEVVPLNQEAWIEANVRTGHGPVGAGYPLVKQNPGSDRNTSGVKEGDTPSWFFVLPNGLSDPEHPEYGGWGGRFRHEEGGHYIDARDEHWSRSDDAGVRRKWTIARWRDAYQRDFAARMDWCVAANYEDANHNPVVVLNGETGRGLLRTAVRAGARITLSAAGSSDPDGDELAYRWFVYTEPGNVADEIALAGERTAAVNLTAPERNEPGELHIICEVTDNGEPPLTSYRRAVITIEPR